ncbi:hypothetical protein MJH12_20165, partial [bacterium]|nr:hypothetical protein [bacterium]
MKLEIRGLSLSFQEDINLISIENMSFDRGIHCLWGISGSGKTSFLKLLSGRIYGARLAGTIVIEDRSFNVCDEKQM